MSALPRMMRVSPLLVVSLTLMAGTAAPACEEGVLRATPTSSSDSEGGQFQQRLVSGGARVRYNGPHRFIRMATLVWKDGKWNECSNTTGLTSVPLDHQISVWLHDTSMTSDEHQYTGVVTDRTDEQMQAIPLTIEKTESGGAGQVLELRTSVNAPNGQPVAIWGYAVYADSAAADSQKPAQPQNESIEQRAQKAAYAVIVTVQMVDQAAGGVHVAETNATAGQDADDVGPANRTSHATAAMAADSGSGSRFDGMW